MKILSVMDYLYRPVTQAMAKRLVDTPLRPNHVTLFRFGMAITIIGCLFLGTRESWMAGGALILLYEFLDRLDGDLARAQGRVSALGGWLELVTEHPVITAPVLSGFALTWALWRADPHVRYWITQLALTYGMLTMNLFVNAEKTAGIRFLSTPMTPGGAGHTSRVSRMGTGVLALQCEVLGLTLLFSGPLDRLLGFPAVWGCLVGYAILFQLAWMGILVNQFLAYRAGNMVRADERSPS